MLKLVGIELVNYILGFGYFDKINRSKNNTTFNIKEINFVFWAMSSHPNFFWWFTEFKNWVVYNLNPIVKNNINNVTGSFNPIVLLCTHFSLRVLIYISTNIFTNQSALFNSFTRLYMFFLFLFFQIIDKKILKKILLCIEVWEKKYVPRKLILHWYQIIIVDFII